jgi:hypothetical protein
MTIHNLGNVEISDFQLRSALIKAATVAGVAPRADSSGAPLFPAGMIDTYRQRLDGMAVEEIRRLRGASWTPDPQLKADAERARADGLELRADALTPGPAGFLRDFDYIHREILEERRPQLSAGMLFPPDSTVPLGAATHTARRAVVAGKAKWHNKGGGFPVAKAGYLEEQFRTGFVVCAVEQSFFEGLQIGYAGLQTYRIEANGAIRAIEEFLNDVAWYGDPARQIYGVLTYPSLAKMVVSTPFTSASTGRAIVAALHEVVNRPMIASGGTFRPNRMAVSEGLHAFLATTPLDAAGGDVTLKEFFLKGQSQTTGIKDIEIASELSAANMTAKGVGNPAGYHGALVWRDDRQSLAHVLPQRPTFLPIWQSSPIDTMHVAFASTGGVTMHDVGNNNLAFIQI